ncbi:GmrSD restriction endonuclease domain-containing protein [Winogradskyella sp.]|uniref:GmrSD restriction endonuclease domain-containing protein n=1 Tax=Winogradskyella sp. TaxID=1883156 RepID=UPI003AA83F44
MKGEITTGSIKIDRLRSKIIEGNIKIPPFQREFVWKQEQVIELLDSIIKDYPIGSILLWETKDDLPSKRNIGGFDLPNPTEDYPINYVLDGQQRVTSIFGVFCYDLENVENEEYDPSIFEILYDINQDTFISSSDINDAHINLPLRLIFDNFNFNKFIQEKNLSEEQTNKVVEVQSLFQNYELPLVTIKKRDKTEVGIIFERVNNTGTPLSTLDLMIAWTWIEDFHLKSKFEDIFETLEDKNFGNVKNKVVLQCISAIINQTTKTKSILELNPQDVRDNMDLLKASLEKAIDFLSTQFNCASYDFLPRVQQIVPLTYLFSRTNSVTIDQSKCLKKWFWRTSFSTRYSASTDQKMDDDVEFINLVLLNDFSGLNKYQTNLNLTQLENLKFSKSNSFVRAFLLLLAQQKPLDLTNGNIVDVGNALSQYNRKQYHHIFPRAFLKDKGLTNDQINKAVNFCILPATSNRLISDKDPSDYFINIIPQANLDTILESNLVPNEKDIYQNDDYDKFYTERAKVVFEKIKELSDE